MIIDAPPPDKDGRRQGSQGFGQGDGQPDAVEAEKFRQNQQKNGDEGKGAQKGDNG